MQDAGFYIREGGYFVDEEYTIPIKQQAIGSRFFARGPRQVCPRPNPHSETNVIKHLSVTLLH